jgi:DNA-binding NtrC family response regulator
MLYSNLAQRSDMNLEMDSEIKDEAETDALPKMLVIDDDPQIAAGLTRALRRHAIVLSTTDARKACRIVEKEGSISLVVLDLSMPDYDAIEFLRELEGMESFPPIVLISGHHRDMLRVAKHYAEAVGINVIGVLEKPFIALKLGEALSKAVSAAR